MKLVVVITELLFFISELRANDTTTLRIVGGRSNAEYPYIVELVYEYLPPNKSITKYYRFCTGAVIRATWALTSAHCQRDLKNMSVRYAATIVAITKFIPHPKYRTSTVNKKTERHNDIALLNHNVVNLKEFAKLSGREYSSLYGKPATYATFGANEQILKNAKRQISDDQLPPIDYNMPDGLIVLNGVIIECDENLQLKLKPGICLAVGCNEKTVVKVSAAADSGSPLIDESGIVGILSLPLTNAAYYVPISYVLGWIRNELKPMSERISKITRTKKIIKQFLSKKKLNSVFNYLQQNR